MVSGLAGFWIPLLLLTTNLMFGEFITENFNRQEAFKLSIDLQKLNIEEHDSYNEVHKSDETVNIEGKPHLEVVAWSGAFFPNLLGVIWLNKDKMS